VDLQDKKNALVKTYSGGMKRRLEIARGLMHSPAVLFLDEPTLGLDAQTRRAIWEYIRRMNREQRTTIFLTTHYMDEADYLCDRIGIIDHGHILVMDSVAALKRSVGSDLVTLSCSDSTALASLVTKEGWVPTLKDADGTLTLSVDHGEEKVPTLVELARTNGITVRSISVRQPMLDDVFLHYTGRSMRDSDQVAKKDDHRQWRWRRR
jgi:ABC-2 type transport system ATP-binding protein